MKTQVREVLQHHKTGEVLLADVLRERSLTIHLQRRVKKSKKKKDIKDLRNFKNKIEGQVLGDVLVPKNLDKDKEFLLNNDIYAKKKVVEGDVVDEMVLVDCNLDANKELTCNIKEVKKSEY